jgi:hypothetical protein
LFLVPILQLLTLEINSRSIRPHLEISLVPVTISVLSEERHQSIRYSIFTTSRNGITDHDFTVAGGRGIGSGKIELGLDKSIPFSGRRLTHSDRHDDCQEIGSERDLLESLGEPPRDQLRI